MTMNEQPAQGDGDATAVAKSPTRLTDSMTAVLNPEDPNTLKGPDPTEWPAAQLVPPEDADRGDYEIKGPDPEKWPQTASEVAPAAGEATVGGNTVASEPSDVGVQIEQPYNSAPDVVTGVLEPPT